MNGNSGGNAAAYIAAVESNYVVVQVGGLTGSGTLRGQSAGHDRLPGFDWQHARRDAPPWRDSTVVSNSKTNSLNCGESGPSPTPSPTAEPDSVTDTEPDSVTDAEPDSVTDTEPDSVADAEPDSVTDAEPDSVTDAEPDSVTDAEPDSVTDTEPDSVGE